MTLSCLVMFKEELPSPSHNTPTSTFLMFIGGTTFSQSLHSPYIIKHICKFPCSIALFQGGTSQLLTKTFSYLIFMKYNRSLITNALQHEGNNSYNSSFFKNTSFYGNAQTSLIHVNMGGTTSSTLQESFHHIRS